MKTSLLALLTLFFANVYSQNYFKLSLKYFQSGDYQVADSLLNLHLKKKPFDKNAIFNHAVTRLYLKDTLCFCKEIRLLKDLHNDKEARKLFYQLCAITDTSYFDEAFSKIEKNKARFFEVKELFKNDTFLTVTLHDKKSDANVYISNPMDLNKSEKTDIIAAYKHYNNNNKVYFFTLNPPKYNDEGVALSNYRDNNPFVNEAKNELGLSKFIVYVQYVFDKSGSIKSVEIVKTNQEAKNLDLLMKYILLFLENMPKPSPATFAGMRVDYLETNSISFW